MILPSHAVAMAAWPLSDTTKMLSDAKAFMEM